MMIGSISAGVASASLAGVPYLANSLGVTRLTRTSVVCADKMVAISSWNGDLKSSSQCASG